MREVCFVLQLALGCFMGIGARMSAIALGFDWPIDLVFALAAVVGTAMLVEREKQEACAAVARRFYESLTEQGFVVDDNGKIGKKDKTESETRAVNEAGV